MGDLLEGAMMDHRYGYHRIQFLFQIIVTRNYAQINGILPFLKTTEEYHSQSNSSQNIQQTNHQQTLPGTESNITEKPKWVLERPINNITNISLTPNN